MWKDEHTLKENKDLRSVIFNDEQAAALVSEKLKFLAAQNFKVGSNIENYYSLCAVDDGLYCLFNC